MRSLGLLGAAAEAEGLLLRRQAYGIARSVAFGGVAAIFGFAALVLLHIAGWTALEQRFGAVQASLALAVADLAVMGLVLLLGRRRHDPIAAAAAMMRDQSLAAAARAPLGFASGALTTGLIRLITRR
jgi:hypothetical protein